MVDGRAGALRVSMVVLALAVAGCSGGDDATPEPTTTTVDLGPDTGDGVLVLGTPDASPATRAGVELARMDIDDGGGVLGEPLTVTPDPSSDADAVIGPRAADGVVSFATELATASPAPDLTFSTVPSAALRAQAVGELVAGDDVASVAVLGVDPSVVATVSATLRAQGVEVVEGDTVDQVAAAGPEAVVLLADDRAADQVAALVDAGFTTADHRFYLAADRVDPALGFAIGDRPGVLEGVRAVVPGAEVDEDLRIRLLEADPTLEDFAGAPEAYDAAVITALAAEAAGTDDPDHVAAEVVGITKGGDTCSSYRECRGYLVDGEDIAYVGRGGAYALDENGEPTRSVFTVHQYGADNLLDPNRTEFLVAVLPDD